MMSHRMTVNNISTLETRSQAESSGRRTKSWKPSLRQELTAANMMLAEINRQRLAMLEKNLHLQEQIKKASEESSRDSLTGLLNRRGRDRAWTREIHLLEHSVPFSERGRIDASVVMIDLDNFKTINDRYGHGAGDAVLQRVVTHLQTTFSRDTDILCRPGGDEFDVILLNTDCPHAYALAGELAESVRQDTTLHFADARVTLSVGVTDIRFTSHRMADDLGEAMSTADALMYISKNNGGDQVTGGTRNVPRPMREEDRVNIQY